MRLLTLAYSSAADFLSAYDEASGTLLAQTKTEATRGESLLVEIAFPRLPNRPLLRAVCAGIVDGGLRLKLDEADALTWDFLMKMARGEVRIESTVHREHKRFPTALAVDYALDGAAKVSSHVEDLGAGGCYVRADKPPGVGALIVLDIVVPEEDAPVHLKGHVAWVRSGKEPGFGVEFDTPDTADNRRLRTILRRAIGTGEVDL